MSNYNGIKKKKVRRVVQVTELSDEARALAWLYACPVAHGREQVQKLTPGHCSPP